MSDVYTFSFRNVNKISTGLRPDLGECFPLSLNGGTTLTTIVMDSLLNDHQCKTVLLSFITNVLWLIYHFSRGSLWPQNYLKVLSIVKSLGKATVNPTTMECVDVDCCGTPCSSLVSSHAWCEEVCIGVNPSTHMVEGINCFQISEVQFLKWQYTVWRRQMV